MPYRVKGRLLLETQSVYYDAYTYPRFDKTIDIAGAKIPLSLRDASGHELATVTTDANGFFDISLSRLPISSDWISIVPVWYIAGKMKVAVLKASSSSSTYPVWEWTIKLANFSNPDDPGDLGDIRITIDQASGGLYLYQQVVQAYEDLLNFGYSFDLGNLPSIAAVWKTGVSWSCGTCYMNTPTEVGKETADSMLLVGGAELDESVWGYPTILHEFGHYILEMNRDDSEGGLHYMSSACEPKLAWSEGWATFYALMNLSLRKKSPVTQYWRVIESGSYWIDYAHLYDNSQSGSIIVPQPKPDSENAMKQNLAESWVTYMLWEFFDGVEIPEPTVNPDPVALGAIKMFDGIRSERYLKLHKYSSGNRSVTGADFVDYVDAVVCALLANDNETMAATLMNLLIERKFPYDRSPVCP